MALTKGLPEEVYFTFGEAIDTVDFFNRACEVAGVPYRVRALREEELASDAVQQRWGSAITRIAAEALHARTVRQLDYFPGKPDAVIGTTVSWLLQNGLIHG